MAYFVLLKLADIFEIIQLIKYNLYIIFSM
jgi:hypothetical protein